jgi:hypothetical protein
MEEHISIKNAILFRRLTLNDMKALRFSKFIKSRKSQFNTLAKIFCCLAANSPVVCNCKTLGLQECENTGVYRNNFFLLLPLATVKSIQ